MASLNFHPVISKNSLNVRDAQRLSIKRGFNINQMSYNCDIYDLNKLILNTLSQESTIPKLSRKNGTFIDDENLDVLERSVEVTDVQSSYDFIDLDGLDDLF